ncbi:hypothetical protein EZJ49_02535 [Bdellovibrio bacteriovorus]|uniref:hypothetical protein n=1 Tax=Bdellovibrio bacteriovorus TaxID=959 RepID=UPI0021CFE9E9|nr:hypothetical protein [Bdellovibrio bacteriovorus]UXR65124.1 hypothetical protein EZJ49_02535 [Bdellovibrio bacteriovorus]
MKNLVLSVVTFLTASVALAANPVCFVEYRSPARSYEIQAELTVEIKENTDLASWVLDQQMESFNARVVEVDGRYLATLSVADVSVHTESDSDLSLSLKKKTEQVTVTCPARY